MRVYTKVCWFVPGRSRLWRFYRYLPTHTHQTLTTHTRRYLEDGLFEIAVAPYGEVHAYDHI